MANRSFNQFHFSLINAMTTLRCQFDVGSSGAVSAIMGSGISNIEKLTAAGSYKITLQDNYNRLLAMHMSVKSPVSGSPVAVTAISPGTIYEITSLGTTTQAQWETAGVPAGVEAVVGLAFEAAATSLGTGAGKVIAASGVQSMEMVGDPNKSVTSRVTPYLIVQLLGATATADTAMIPKNAASGSRIMFDILLRNSSQKETGE